MSDNPHLTAKKGKETQHSDKWCITVLTVFIVLGIAQAYAREPMTSPFKR